ncbi:hypothetical protein TorRG33x02_122290 [Trema orientale]|uniref:Uncharacterized protein n=1 Tax=Trema orientale TaxID=63057 RepID=A0A2P5F294_TREOI|nr:hypothetical protein TorRG33x02_122290 [Trema orientale]
MLVKHRTQRLRVSEDGAVLIDCKQAQSCEGISTHMGVPCVDQVNVAVETPWTRSSAASTFLGLANES